MGAPAVNPEPTFARRLAFKSLGGIFALPLNLALQAMVPRALGAAAYGNYAFVSAFFTEVLNFADSGSSQGFYSKISQRPTERLLAAFYARFVLVVLVALGLGIALAFAVHAAPRLWPGLPAAVVLLGAAMAFGNWVIGLATKSVDAHARTTRGETTALAVRALLVALTAGAFVAGVLTIRAFLSLQVLCNTILVGALLVVLAPGGYASAFVARLDRAAVRKYRAEFWTYCHPLLLLSFCAAGANVADRWLLQHFAGSVQQGFIGLGMQIGSVVFLFGSAIASLAAREFARAHHDNDAARLQDIFVRYLSGTYVVTAYFAIFVAWQADDVVRLFGGDQFSGAAVATAIVCLYPLHQVIGQLGSAALYATERTKATRNVGLVGVALGLIMTLFFLAPRSAGGLGLGALGLAAKMVIHQIIVVNLTLWVNARLLKVRFTSLLIMQLAPIATLVACAFLARRASLFVASSALMSFLVSGIIYTALVAALAALAPRALGMDRGELRKWTSRARGVLARPVRRSHP